VTIGQVKGQTLLPLPPSDIAPQEPVVLHDKDKIHILEGAVITWTRQIKDVLKADSESALKVKQHFACTKLSEAVCILVCVRSLSTLATTHYRQFLCVMYGS